MYSSVFCRETSARDFLTFLTSSNVCAVFSVLESLFQLIYNHLSACPMTHTCEENMGEADTTVLPNSSDSSLYLGLNAAPSSPFLMKCCAESWHNIAGVEIKQYYLVSRLR